jgi:hypothetical protein
MKSPGSSVLQGRAVKWVTTSDYHFGTSTVAKTSEKQ